MPARTWTAIVLCFLIWFAYIRWFAPLPPVPPPGMATNQPADVNNPVQSNEAPQTVPVRPQNALSRVAPLKNSFSKNTGVIEVDFSSVGGKIADVRTVKYRTTTKKDAPLMPVVSSEDSPQKLATLFTHPTLVDFSYGEYTPIQTNENVTFSRTQNGITVAKEYAFNPDSYVIDSIIKISGNLTGRELGQILIPVGAKSPAFDSHDPLKSWEVVYQQNEEIHRVHTDKIEGTEKVVQGTTQWLAYGNRYFASAVMNESEINPDVVLTRQDEFVGAYLRYPLVFKEGQKELVLRVKYYVGAKDYNALSALNGMRGLIDYGFFKTLAYPLLEILRFFYSFVHNYGIAIILLTILVRLLFYPLSVKSMRSMKAMQKLQPQIAVIKEKYKDDMKKMNEEQMALFKTHKVNPAGGCLPMLVQLPVFVALYAVLANSIELFQAPFFGWVQDLSAKDPFYIYPVLMGVTMFVQQKMTPAVGMDPMQQKMMLIMPVFFSFLMINLPAGLTMYIFVSTLLGIAQQVAMKDPKVSVPATAS